MKSVCKVCIHRQKHIKCNISSKSISLSHSPYKQMYFEFSMPISIKLNTNSMLHFRIFNF